MEPEEPWYGIVADALWRWRRQFDVVDALGRMLVARGRSVAEAPHLYWELEGTIVESLAGQELTDKEMESQAQQLFLAELQARGCHLKAAQLVSVGQPRQYTIGDRQKECLWLGWHRRDSLGLAGLWQLYLRTGGTDADGNSYDVCTSIQGLFDPRCRDGEDQRYVFACLACRNADRLIPLPPSAGTRREAVQTLAKMNLRLEKSTFDGSGLTVSPNEAPILKTLLACVPIDPLPGGLAGPAATALVGLIARLAGAGVSALPLSPAEAKTMGGVLSWLQSQSDDDTSNLLGWLTGQRPGTVDQNLLRGSNTLMDMFLARVYVCIDVLFWSYEGERVQSGVQRR